MSRLGLLNFFFNRFLFSEVFCLKLCLNLRQHLLYGVFFKHLGKV